MLFEIIFKFLHIILEKIEINYFFLHPDFSCHERVKNIHMFQKHLDVLFP